MTQIKQYQYDQVRILCWKEFKPIMSYYHLLHGMQTKAPVYNGRIMQKKGWCVHWRKIGRGNKATHKMYAIFISITKKRMVGLG